jgi:VCPO second helical-bundle domain/Domain of unknown function (DUF6851)
MLRSFSPKRALQLASAILLFQIQCTAAVAAFDLDTGNAPVEVIIPTVVPIIFTDVSPTGSDVTLVIRVTTLVTNALFDASAPYHSTAQGVYSRLGRRPASERTTNRNINIACFYASYQVLNSLLPNRNADWRAMLSSVGLDPDDASEDTTTPIGIGNVAGKAVVAFREHDGMNQLGDHGGRMYNLEPYADYTGFEPVNTAYDLRDPSKWQPRILPTGNGTFHVQQFVTPQYRFVTPYSFGDPNQFNTPRPFASNPKGPHGRQAYQEQADEVLQASANLTDYHKMAAELFNNKIRGLGFSVLFAAQSHNLDLLDFIHLDFMTNVAAFDAGIVSWNEKTKWNSVRPFSAIRYLYGDRPVTAWGGPGKGTVTDLPASQWKEYLNLPDHPEYPSVSTAMCEAQAQAARRFFSSDELNWSVPAPQGSSTVEPGITPKEDITLGPWATWTDFANECGLSRLWGGLHFRAAIEASRQFGPQVGELAYEFVTQHIEGNARPLPTSSTTEGPRFPGCRHCDKQASW